MLRRSRFVTPPLLALLGLLSAPLAAEPAAAPATVVKVATDRAWTRLFFDRALLAGYGFEVDPDVDRIELEAVPPSSFVVDAADADFEGITRGSLRHLGGFTLRFRGKSVPFVGFEIVPGKDPLTLDLLDSRGRRLFRGDQMHFYYDPATNRLRLENVDVRISAELAAEIGAPELGGIAIARLELEATTRAERSPAPEGTLDCSPAVWVGDVDVDLSQVFGAQQIVRDSGKVTINIATQLRNVGTADVPWRRKFLGSYAPYNNDQHPYLVWAAYRIAPVSGDDGAPTAVEMLGQSALKHAFYATNQGCQCAGGQILWAPIGGTHDTDPCTDVYGTGNNNDPNALGPRDELEAHSGIWVSTGSFFDPDADGVCDAGGSNGNDCDGSKPFTDSFDRRLAVYETDLSTPGASYLMDAWYIVRDDVNIFNTMGWKPITPIFGGSSWTFGMSNSTVPHTPGSMLEAWVPRAAPPAGSSHERIDTGVGHLSLAAKTTDLGDGQWHYEYALANHDFDRKVQSFRVPFPAGTTISNAVFRGLVNGGGADWTTSVEADAITFQAPADKNVNALEWGTLFSFGFDTDLAPVAGGVGLGALEETPSLVIPAAAQVPGALFVDGFESGGPGRWTSTVG